MKLYLATESAAQSKADAIHSWLIATNPAYAQSVANGKTVRWDMPHQDFDQNGRPIGTQWYVNVEDKCMGALTAHEVAQLV